MLLPGDCNPWQSAGTWPGLAGSSMHELAQKLKPVLWRERGWGLQEGLGRKGADGRVSVGYGCTTHYSFVAVRSSGNGAHGNHGNAPSSLICFCAGAMSDDCEGEIILCAYWITTDAGDDRPNAHDTNFNSTVQSFMYADRRRRCSGGVLQCWADKVASRLISTSLL